MFLKEPWIRIPGSLRQIDTGYSRAVWGTNRNNQIWKLKRDRKSWKSVSGRLVHVSPGEGGVWGVNKYRYIYYRLGKMQTTYNID